MGWLRGRPCCDSTYHPALDGPASVRILSDKPQRYWAVVLALRACKNKGHAMYAKLLASTCIVLLVLFGAIPAPAQTFDYTLVVDQSGNWDYTTIQDAINSNRIGNDPSDRWTILIYAGEYAENVALGERKENVDLVGIDPDAVIIKPSSGDGITITAGGEAARNNSIRNLTIKTTSGHGIKIVRGGEDGDQEPKNIIIEGVTIEAAGSDKQGISASEVQELRVANTKIKTANGHGIEIVKPDGGSAPTGITITGVTIRADGAGKMGLSLKSVERVTVENSHISSEEETGVYLYGDPRDVTVRGCEIRAGWYGMRIQRGDHILLSGCHIVADNSDSDAEYIVGLFYDRMSGGGPYDPTDIVAIGCRIEAVGAGTDTETTYTTVGVQTDTDTFPRVVNCQIVATAAKDAVYGVFGGGGNNLDPNIVVVGGVITTECGEEKQTEVWDLRQNNPGAYTGRSGTRLSKWSGPIESAERVRSVMQRTVGVSAPSASAILNSTQLTDAEQEITTGITQPDVFRVLSASGSGAGMDQDVYIIGTDWAGDPITDKITLDGANTVAGVKPFKTVTKIILPPRNNGLQAVRVGSTSKLGLQFSISLAGDVLQQGRKASAATSYTLESAGSVNVTYATVDISSITGGDSFEWAVLASQ